MESCKNGKTGSEKSFLGNKPRIFWFIPLFSIPRPPDPQQLPPIRLSFVNVGFRTRERKKKLEPKDCISFKEKYKRMDVDYFAELTQREAAQS
jgi:hypothetical protein